MRQILIGWLGLWTFGFSSSLLADHQPLPEQQGDWHGFPKHTLQVEGKRVTVIAPHQTAPGRPWIWHGEFFGHKPEPDIALLGQGFHIVSMRIPDMLGSPRAVAYWNACYDELTSKYGFASKVGLVGLSRGGLYCYNWAIANPGRVACIYGDAPVCDFKSWPGGRGQGKGHPPNWKLVLQQYGFENDEQALAYDGNPVDRLEPLAKAGIPLLHVYGEADQVVPWEENTGLLASRYRALGGSIELIAKPGVGHHPHGLKDSRPIVEFFLKHAVVSAPSPTVKKKRRPSPVRELASQLEPTIKIVYKEFPDRELLLHLFEPEAEPAQGPRPCLILFHGGGWVGGEPRVMYPFARHAASKGWIGISVQYRLLRESKANTVFHCVEDGQSAVRFVRRHADRFGIDPKQIIVGGASAGGHVAAETALFSFKGPEHEQVSCRPDALVLFFPVIDTSKEGYGQAKIGDRWRELSPVDQVKAGVPPTLLFHGTGDSVTPYAGAKRFHQRMLSAGNRCELVTHDGGRHGYLMFDRQSYLDTLKVMDEFLESLGIRPVKSPEEVSK